MTSDEAQAQSTNYVVEINGKVYPITGQPGIHTWEVGPNGDIGYYPPDNITVPRNDLDLILSVARKGDEHASREEWDAITRMCTLLGIQRF